ncbi:unnamed protein product [Rhizophagus irregularis]|nr:unnamed protein product [Rhizophagus irregularis]
MFISDFDQYFKGLQLAYPPICRFWTLFRNSYSAKTHWILKSLTKKNCIYTFYKSWTRFVCKVLYSYAVHSFTHQHDNGSSYSSPYSSTKVIKKYNQRQGLWERTKGNYKCIFHGDGAYQILSEILNSDQWGKKEEIDPLEQLIHQQSKNYKKTRRPKFSRGEILVEWKKRVSREINGNLCTAGVKKKNK